MPKRYPSESEGLHSFIGNGFILGVVRGVNDAAAELVEDFQPTRYELEILAEHYIKAIVNIECFGEAFGESGSYEIRFGPFAGRRLQRIRSTLGEEDYKMIIDPIVKKHEEALVEMRERVNNPMPCSQCGQVRCGPVPMDEYEGICNKCQNGND